MIKMVNLDPKYALQKYLLLHAIQGAFDGKNTITGKELLPNGIFEVAYRKPTNLVDILLHPFKKEVIVTVEGEPIREYYEKVTQSCSLGLEDRANGAMETNSNLVPPGAIRWDIYHLSIDTPAPKTVASITYDQTWKDLYHKVTVRGARNADKVAEFLAKYLML